MPAATPLAPAGISPRAWGYFLLCVVLLTSFLWFGFKDWTELPLYELAASRLQKGEPIYRHFERPWTYPALFALPFVPLLSLPPWLRAPLWHGCNCAIILFLVWRLERRVGPVIEDCALPRRSPLWLFWGLVALLAGRHVLSPLENQSHDLVVLLCVWLAIEAHCAGAELTAGWWAGLGAALKATPLLFLPVFLWQRRYRAAATLAISVPVLVLLPDLLYPSRDDPSWTVAWHREFLTAIRPGETAVSSAWDPWCQLNQSLAGTLKRLLVPLPAVGRDLRLRQVDVSVLSVSPALLRCATLVGQSGVLLSLLWVTRSGVLAGLSARRAAWGRFGQGAAVATAMVLLSPTSIKTHFGVLLLPVVFCLVDYLYVQRDRVVGGGLLLTFLLGTLTAKDLIGKDLGNQLMASGSVTWCALALLLATGQVLLQRPRQWRQQQPDTPVPSKPLAA
jgi:hypothetical protein